MSSYRSLEVIIQCKTLGCLYCCFVQKAREAMNLLVVNAWGFVRCAAAPYRTPQKGPPVHRWTAQSTVVGCDAKAATQPWSQREVAAACPHASGSGRAAHTLPLATGFLRPAGPTPAGEAVRMSSFLRCPGLPREQYVTTLKLYDVCI